MERYPFDYQPDQSFVQQASDWIADVFYDLLPDAGFEVRDEQIFMAFQLERAYAEKKTILAEAGVGTGKTFVYLLYALLYARYTRKPAIIACADESLIEQLVKPEGDIVKLAKHLNLTIDARLGKSMDQYLCLKKLDKALDTDPDVNLYQPIYEQLPEFVRQPSTMQKFHAYGDRKDYPSLNDSSWRKIGWDTFQDCLVCDQRHRCGQTLSRDHYRKSADIIICSHDFYMEHVWTYEARKREGQLPLLPEASSVVFDEGHLLEFAAQKALTYKLNPAVLEEILTRLLQGEIRESLALQIERTLEHSEHLFNLLSGHSRAVKGSERRELLLDADLFQEVQTFLSLIDAIEEELVFESGLHTLDGYQLRIVEEHLEMIQIALGLFRNPEQLITWIEQSSVGVTLVVMPRLVKEIMKERVFSKKIPIVFSSATLSTEGSFDYLAESLGIQDYLSFSVPSPYDYVNQMEVFAPKLDEGDLTKAKMKSAASLLQQSEGRALLLFNSKEELAEFKSTVSAYSSVSELRMLFEGDQEISHLISEFQQDEHSVLCAVSLWEGLDVPGPSLSNVIIWSLPFPPNDPVFMAKRKNADDAYAQVDLPYMLLRLRQGIGRLIRTREDRGIIAILDQQLHRDPMLLQKVTDVLPTDVKLLT